MIVYTDDCLIFPKEDVTINSLIKSLNTTYLLEDQGTVSDYLGIQIVKNCTSKQIHMSQPGLIDSILQDLHLIAGSHTKDTTAMGILHPDSDAIQGRIDGTTVQSLASSTILPKTQGLTSALPFTSVHASPTTLQPFTNRQLNGVATTYSSLETKASSCPLNMTSG